MRGSHNAGYGAQVQLEKAILSKKPISGITLDLMKCFNCIRQEAGRRALLALGLPKEHVHQWYHSIHKLQRYWEIDSSSHGPVLATCGFPEGDSHSVLVMLAIALSDLECQPPGFAFANIAKHLICG